MWSLQNASSELNEVLAAKTRKHIFLLISPPLHILQPGERKTYAHLLAGAKGEKAQLRCGNLALRFGFSGESRFAAGESPEPCFR